MPCTRARYANLSHNQSPFRSERRITQESKIDLFVFGCKIRTGARLEWRQHYLTFEAPKATDNKHVLVSQNFLTKLKKNAQCKK